MPVEMRFLGHVAHVLLVGNQVAPDEFAIEQDVARGGLQKPGDHFHGGGLAGAVGPQVSGDFTGARPKAHVIHGGDTAESFADVAKFQHAGSFRFTCLGTYVANYSYLVK
jgi:hypothetical protein